MQNITLNTYQLNHKVLQKVCSIPKIILSPLAFIFLFNMYNAQREYNSIFKNCKPLLIISAVLHLHSLTTTTKMYKSYSGALIFLWKIPGFSGQDNHRSILLQTLLCSWELWELDIFSQKRIHAINLFYMKW